MEATIEISNLHKRFGATVTLDGMTFTVAPDPTRTALIGGQRCQSLRQPLSHVGSLLDASALQPSRSVRNHSGQLKHPRADRAPGTGRPRGGTR